MRYLRNFCCSLSILFSTGLTACILDPQDNHRASLHPIDLSQPLSLNFHDGIEDAAEKYKELLENHAPYAADFTQQFRSWAMVECAGDLYKAFTTYHHSLDIFYDAFIEHLNTLKNWPDEAVVSTTHDTFLALEKMAQNKHEAMSYWNLIDEYFKFMQKIGDFTEFEKSQHASFTGSVNQSLTFNQILYGLKKYQLFELPDPSFQNEVCLPESLSNQISAQFLTRLIIPTFGVGLNQIPFRLFQFLQGAYPLYGSVKSGPYHYLTSGTDSTFGNVFHDIIHCSNQTHVKEVILSLISDVITIYKDASENCGNQQGFIIEPEASCIRHYAATLIERESYRYQAFYNAVTHFFKQHLVKEVLLSQNNEALFRELTTGLFLLFHENRYGGFSKEKSTGLRGIFNNFASSFTDIEYSLSLDSINFFNTCPQKGTPFKDEKLMNPEEFMKACPQEIDDYLTRHCGHPVNFAESNGRISYKYAPLAKAPIVQEINLSWQASNEKVCKLTADTLATTMININDRSILEWTGIKVPTLGDLSDISFAESFDKGCQIYRFIITSFLKLVSQTQTHFEDFLVRHDLEKQYRERLKFFDKQLDELHLKLII